MSQQPISFNINGLAHGFPSDNELRAYLRRLNPRSVLIMDNFGLAVAIKDDMPECVVVHRDFHAADGGEWQQVPPAEWVARWQRQGHPEIVRYTSNEPYPSPEYAKAEAEIVRAATNAGFTVCGFCVSVGSYEPSDVRRGVYDEVLKAIIDGGHYIGVHEYMTVSLPASLKPIPALLDPDALQPGEWMTQPEFIREYVNTDYPETAWYLFRHIELVDRLRSLGYSREQLRDCVLITEFGYDNLLDDSTKDYIEPLKQKYGMDIYHRDMRGVMSYQRLHADYFPDMTYDERILREFEWWLELWQVSYWLHSAQLFTLNLDWQVPQAHHYGDLPAVVDGLTTMNVPSRDMQPTPPDEPTPELTEMMVRGRDNGTPVNVNIRSMPSTEAIAVGVVSDEWQTIRADMGNVIIAGGYEWRYIETERTSGYVAWEFIQELPDEEHDPPPTTPPETEAYYALDFMRSSFFVTEQERRVLMTIFHRLHQMCVDAPQVSATDAMRDARNTPTLTELAGMVLDRTDIAGDPDAWRDSLPDVA